MTMTQLHTHHDDHKGPVILRTARTMTDDRNTETSASIWKRLCLRPQTRIQEPKPIDVTK